MLTFGQEISIWMLQSNRFFHSMLAIVMMLASIKLGMDEGILYGVSMFLLAFIALELRVLYSHQILTRATIGEDGHIVLESSSGQWLVDQLIKAVVIVVLILFGTLSLLSTFLGS